MNRYFFRIMYDGTAYSGWQRQSNAVTVQECIEDALTSLCRRSIKITGCGRTDAGVHASDYFFHVDLDPVGFTPDEYAFKLNKMLPRDIAIRQILPVHSDAHARFDAIRRSYIYELHFSKDPFDQRYSYRYNQLGKPDFEKLEEAASLFKSYNAFYPFCKTKTDVKNYNCEIYTSRWIQQNANKWSYHICANRFLRGMVRLMVGACLRVAAGKLEFNDLKKSLDDQCRLEEAWSVPASGLRLSQIEYPYI